MPAEPLLAVQPGGGPVDGLTGHRGRRELEPLAALVGQHQFTGLLLVGAPLRGGRLLRRSQADDGVDRQLGGPADRLQGLLRVLDARHLHDDAVGAGPDQVRFGHSEGVDAAAQHLQRLVHRLVVQGAAGGLLGLQGDLGAALEIESEPGLGREQHGPRAEQHEEGEQSSEEERTLVRGAGRAGGAGWWHGVVSTAVGARRLVSPRAGVTGAAVAVPPDASVPCHPGRSPAGAHAVRAGTGRNPRRGQTGEVGGERSPTQ